MSATAVKRRRLSADERHRLILESASQAFADAGYHGATIDQIARGAGVTVPVVYDHFGSKAELYRELLLLHGRALIEATTRVEPGLSPEEVLRANVDAFFSFVERNRAAWRMLFRDPPPDPDTAALQERIQEQATARLAKTLVAQVPGLKTSVRVTRARANELIAEAGKSALNGLAHWWWKHPRVPRGTLVGIAMDLLWTGLGNLGRPPGRR